MDIYSVETSENNLQDVSMLVHAEIFHDMCM